MAGGSRGESERDCEELSTVTILRPDGGKRPEFFDKRNDRVDYERTRTDLNINDNHNDNEIDLNENEKLKMIIKFIFDRATCGSWTSKAAKPSA